MQSSQGPCTPDCSSCWYLCPLLSACSHLCLHSSGGESDQLWSQTPALQGLTVTGACELGEEQGLVPSTHHGFSPVSIRGHRLVEALPSGMLPGTTVGGKTRENHESALPSTHPETLPLSPPCRFMALWAFLGEEQGAEGRMLCSAQAQRCALALQGFHPKVAECPQRVGPVFPMPSL